MTMVYILVSSDHTKCSSGIIGEETLHIFLVTLVKILLV